MPLNYGNGNGNREWFQLASRKVIKKLLHMKGLVNKNKPFLLLTKHIVYRIKLYDLQFVSLFTVARATDNFSVANKIREGGFG